MRFRELMRYVTTNASYCYCCIESGDCLLKPHKPTLQLSQKQNLSSLKETEIVVEEALKLFFSYSHKDEALRNELGNHLKILEHQQLIASWHDRKILPGDEWDHQITVNQDTADIILLLISSDFIASKYCWDIEIKRAMELHELDNARVVPVILREADWENAPFSKLQAVPKNAQPVTTFPDRDAAFKFVTQQIRRVATELIERRRKLREQQQKDNAIATYRQKFEEFAADGEISFGEQFLLDDLQQKLKLTDADIQAIKQSILNPVLVCGL